MKEFDFESIELDDEEKLFEEESDNFVSIKNQDEMRKKMIEAAKNEPIIHKAENIFSDFAFSHEDSLLLANKAKEQGLTSKALLGSILHKYLTGLLVDVQEAKKIFALQ